MCQHGSLWIPSATAGELQIRHVVRAYYAVEDVQEMVWNGFSSADEFIVMDEPFMLAPY